MSPQTPLSNESPSPTPETESRRQTHPGGHGFGESLRSLKEPAQFVCFWAAVALPFLLVSLLAYGIDQGPVALAFLVLLAVNLVALYVGHGYNQN